MSEKMCSSCKKLKKQKEYLKKEHKTCEKCLMRIRKYERKNKMFYTGHQK